MGSIQQSKKLINLSTGEILDEKTVTFPAYFDEEKGYLFWVRKNHARSFHGIPYPKEMSDSDIGKLARLAKHIWSNTNMLAYRGNGGIRPLDIDGIAEVLDLKPRRVRSYIKKMVTLGVMAKSRTKVGDVVEDFFYINPIYFCSSKRIPLHLYLIFKKQLDEVLPTWVIQRFNETTTVRYPKK